MDPVNMRRLLPGEDVTSLPQEQSEDSAKGPGSGKPKVVGPLQNLSKRNDIEGRRRSRRQLLTEAIPRLAADVASLVAAVAILSPVAGNLIKEGVTLLDDASAQRAKAEWIPLAESLAHAAGQEGTLIANQMNVPRYLDGREVNIPALSKAREHVASVLPPSNTSPLALGNLDIGSLFNNAPELNPRFVDLIDALSKYSGILKQVESAAEPLEVHEARVQRCADSLALAKCQLKEISYFWDAVHDSPSPQAQRSQLESSGATVNRGQQAVDYAQTALDEAHKLPFYR